MILITLNRHIVWSGEFFTLQVK